jgi:uncharacterized protein (TIGR03435 family)
MRTTFLPGAAALAVFMMLAATPRPHAQSSFLAPAGAIPAPDPAIPLYFEAASIKPSDPSQPNPGFAIRRQPGGRFNAVNAPLRNLIIFAYQIQSFQLVSAPNWTNDARVDIVAKMEGDPQPVAPGSGADHMMLAMRTLLADRFKLVVHRETRELDIYALAMAKPGGRPGPALKQSNPADCSPETLKARQSAPPAAGGAPPVICGMQGAPGRIRFGGFPLSLFANGISNQVGRAVVDRTGLTGNWDFELTFRAQVNPANLPPGVEAPPTDPNAPDLFTAIQEQLGLKLESTKGPVEVLVVDSVQPLIPD